MKADEARWVRLVSGYPQPTPLALLSRRCCSTEITLPGLEAEHSRSNNDAVEQGVEADEAWLTSELRSLTPVFGGRVEVRRMA